MNKYIKHNKTKYIPAENRIYYGFVMDSTEYIKVTRNGMIIAIIKADSLAEIRPKQIIEYLNSNPFKIHPERAALILTSSKFFKLI